MLEDFVALLRKATFPHISLQCVGAMVLEWLWCRDISFVFCSFVHIDLGFTPYIALFVGMWETPIYDPSREIGDINIYILFSHYKFNIIRQNSR